MDSYFQEEQRLGRGFLLAAVAAWIVFMGLLALRIIDEDGRAVLLALGEWMLIGLLVALLVYLPKLTTEVTPQDVKVKISLWRPRRISLRDIERVEAITYRPMRDYGGWGIKYSFKNKGWAYTMSGNRGVRVFLRNGKNVLVGSQRPEELAAAIEVARSARS